MASLLESVRKDDGAIRCYIDGKRVTAEYFYEARRGRCDCFHTLNKGTHWHYRQELRNPLPTN